MTATSDEQALPVMLRVSELSKTYGSGSRAVEAVRNISFEVARGELVCIVGPSGAGKTTTLKCLAGLLTPTSGRMEVAGEEVRGPIGSMAAVFQEYGRSLFPWMRVRANVELPLKVAGVSKRERRRRADDALEAVELSASADKYPWQLSGGMQQRVAIARALAYEPQVLLMDEPFAAVDAQTRADLEDLVRRLWMERDITIVFITHDIDESIYLGQRVLVLSHAPTVVQRVIPIDLPAQRDQITTRSTPRFGELRALAYAEVQRAKRGHGAGVETE